MGWTERKTRSLMDEIEDLGYWQKREGHPVFNPGLIPARPVPSWAEPVGARLTPDRATPAGRTPVNYPTTNHQSNHPTNETPFGGFSIRPGRMSLQGSKSDIYNLTDYFAYKVRKTYGGFAPDPINCEAVRASIRRWVTKDGISPAMVKAMIDTFVSQPQSLRSGVPAWKAFLAQRQKLLTMVEDTTKRRARESYWKRAED